MDYQKLMAQLEAEVNSGFGQESKPAKAPAKKKAFESFDSIESELAESMGYKPSLTEGPEAGAIESADEELVFNEEEPVEGSEEVEEGESPEAIFEDSVRAIYQSFVDAGEESPGSKVRDIVENILREFEEGEEEEATEGCNNKGKAAEEEALGDINKTSQPVEEVKAHTVATEAAGKGSIVERLKALGGISSATESEKPKYCFKGRKKTAEEGVKDAPAKKKVSLEEMGDERLSRAISRYTELAKGNKGTGSIYSVTESMGEKRINLNDHCLGRACVEYGYTRDNLKKAIVESIQKGVI